MKQKLSEFLIRSLPSMRLPVCVAASGLGLFVISGSGCSADSSAKDQVSSKTESVCYHGQRRPAERSGDVLVIEGDMVVDKTDGSCDDQVPGLKAQGRRIPASGTTTNGFNDGKVWPGGVVPYVIDPNFTVANQNRILGGMSRWASMVPGLTFRPKVATDASYVNFFLHATACNSPVGSGTGARTINMLPVCMTNPTTGADDNGLEHEIGHVLGLQHEQTRPDRNDFIVISGDVDFNYTIDTGANILAYDFESVMHYALFPPTTSLKPGVVVPPCPLCVAGEGIPGQKSHLSMTDAQTMQAMYPQAKVQTLLFANTGASPACRLDGRELDINTDFSKTSSVPALSGAGNTANTTGLALGDFAVTCTIKSLFWSRNYNYPNSTFLESIPAAPASAVQTYTDTQTVRVLSAGVIPLLLATG
jgi:hypothetical protein